MQVRFDRPAYKDRCQAETVMSMLKRRQGSHTNGRNAYSQRRDLYLIALTHNAMILVIVRVFYRAAQTEFERNARPHERRDLVVQRSEFHERDVASHGLLSVETPTRPPLLCTLWGSPPLGSVSPQYSARPKRESSFHDVDKTLEERETVPFFSQGTEKTGQSPAFCPRL